MFRKLALIIGNDDYQSSPLKNCVNDANSLAGVLKSVGCEVHLEVNLKSEDMYERIKDFTEAIQPDDFIIFFFAGHAVQWGDQNFLLPCDNKRIIGGRDMQHYATNAQDNVNEMAKMNPHVILFLLDCCRDYWLPTSKRSIPDNQQVSGLHTMTPPPGTLIAFACAAGETASDQSSGATNGIFTKHLLKHIITPGLDIEMVLRKVANDVSNETKHSQRPYRVTNITTDNVCLVPIDATTEQSINILLIGEKGVGKSTFINAFVNYLTSKDLEQAQLKKPVVLKPLSFVMALHDNFEIRTVTFGDFNPPNQSVVERCQNYTFDLKENDGKKLCLIDTPSLEHAHDYNQANSNQIKHILEHVNNLTHLNAVCFILKPEASQLSNSFQSCFSQLLNRLGTNARQNVIFCFTNTLMAFSNPGNTAPLLRKMFASCSMNDVPFSRANTFCFDNESFRY